MCDHVLKPRKIITPVQKNATPIDIHTKELRYSVFYFYGVAVSLQNFEISYGVLYFLELCRYSYTYFFPGFG